MKNTCLYTTEACPTCQETKWEWLIWCTNCGIIVCSSCVDHNHHANGLPFDIPGRGKRYYAE